MNYVVTAKLVQRERTEIQVVGNEFTQQQRIEVSDYECLVVTKKE